MSFTKIILSETLWTSKTFSIHSSATNTPTPLYGKVFLSSRANNSETSTVFVKHYAPNHMQKLERGITLTKLIRFFQKLIKWSTHHPQKSLSKCKHMGIFYLNNSRSYNLFKWVVWSGRNSNSFWDFMPVPVTYKFEEDFIKNCREISNAIFTILSQWDLSVVIATRVLEGYASTNMQSIPHPNNASYQVCFRLAYWSQQCLIHYNLFITRFVITRFWI